MIQESRLSRRPFYIRLSNGVNNFMRQAWAPYVLLIAAVLLAYANIYRNDFVFDDFALIVINKFLQYSSSLPQLLGGLTNSGAGMETGYYRPLQMLFYFVIYQAFGLSTIAFHTFNLALHITNACLVFRLGRVLEFRPGAVFTAVLLWVLHPLHTEAVTYMSGAADLLAAFFCLLSLIVLAPGFMPRNIWFATFLMALAIGSKESAVMFPALATVTLFLVDPERRRPATYIKTWPLWLLAGIYVALRLLLMQRAGFSDGVGGKDITYRQLYEHNAWNRVLTSLRPCLFICA